MHLINPSTLRSVIGLFVLASMPCAWSCSTVPLSATPQAAPQAKPVAGGSTLYKVLDINDARRIVTEVNQSAVLRVDHPLAAPKSFDDAEHILRLDQVSLFPRAIDFLKGKTTVQHIALAGQLELAWAEGIIIQIEVMRRLHATFTTLSKETTHAQENLDYFEQQTRALERLVPPLAALVMEHLAAGIAHAQRAISTAPDNYLGYRVAADYYRLIKDWATFDAMLAEVRTRNPNSNGLRFLEGAKAIALGHDAQQAAAHYTQAMQVDPGFVRAQTHLLMLQDNPQSLHAELKKLRAMNPDHQLIRLLGDSIARAEQASR